MIVEFVGGAATFHEVENRVEPSTEIRAGPTFDRLAVRVEHLARRGRRRRDAVPSGKHVCREGGPFADGGEQFHDQRAERAAEHADFDLFDRMV